jgi:hypothetical protein
MLNAAIAVPRDDMRHVNCVNATSI